MDLVADVLTRLLHGGVVGGVLEAQFRRAHGLAGTVRQLLGQARVKGHRLGVAGPAVGRIRPVQRTMGQRFLLEVGTEEVAECPVPVDGIREGSPQVLVLQRGHAMVDGQEVDTAVPQGLDRHAGNGLHLPDGGRGQIQEQVQTPGAAAKSAAGSVACKKWISRMCGRPAFPSRR